MKVKLIATPEQLQSVGCDRADISNTIVHAIHDYEDGYWKILAPPKKEIREILGDRAQKEEYDIPYRWLQKI